MGGRVGGSYHPPGRCGDPVDTLTCVRGAGSPKRWKTTMGSAIANVEFRLHPEVKAADCPVVIGAAPAIPGSLRPIRIGWKLVRAPAQSPDTFMRKPVSDTRSGGDFFLTPMAAQALEVRLG